jgi:hypothetical protein
MRSLLRLTAGFVFVALGNLAEAEDEAVSNGFTRPVWSVVGSLESTYTNNAFLTESDKQSDVYWTPDISIRGDGKLTSDIYYRIYARGDFDAFTNESDADNSVARIGVRLATNVFDWTASIAYENRYAFGSIFDDRLFTGHDVIGSMLTSVDWSWISFSPGALLTYRFADVDESQRFRMELWLGIEVPLDEKWSVVSEPFFEQFWFTDGLNSGRQDSVYSVSLGLQYAITENANLTTEVVYESGTSNRPGLDYDFIEVGPRLDFVF